MSLFDEAKAAHAKAELERRRANALSAVATPKYIRTELADAESVIYNQIKDKALTEYAEKGYIEHVSFQYTKWGGFSLSAKRYGEEKYGGALNVGDIQKALGVAASSALERFLSEVDRDRSSLMHYQWPSRWIDGPHINTGESREGGDGEDDSGYHFQVSGRMKFRTPITGK